MKKHIRVVLVAAIAAIILMAAANIGGARTLTPNARQGTPDIFVGVCVPGVNPLPGFSCMIPDWLDCPAGVQPEPGVCGQKGGPPGPEFVPFNYDTMKDCAPGAMPTPTTPCRFQMQPCAEGQRPSMDKPCRPGGGEGGGEGGKEGEMGGFDAPPTNDIKKEMQNKYMVINISTEGAGDANGSLDVTFVKVVSGVKKATMEYLNDQLVGESFVIQTSAKTKCFADTKDADKIPDLVACKELDDAADNSPGSIKSQFRGKIKFNAATYEPEFTAQKVIFLKGSFNVAKIG